MKQALIVVGILWAAGAFAGEKRSLYDDALTAWRCAAEKERTEVLQTIRQEQKYAKIGGALDLAKLHDVQDELRHLDEFISEVKSEQRQRARKPEPKCEQPIVQKTVECVRAKWQIPPSAGKTWPKFLPAECRNEITIQMLSVYEGSFHY